MNWGEWKARGGREGSATMGRRGGAVSCRWRSRRDTGGAAGAPLAATPRGARGPVRGAARTDDAVWAEGSNPHTFDWSTVGQSGAW